MGADIFAKFSAFIKNSPNNASKFGRLFLSFTAGTSLVHSSIVLLLLSCVFLFSFYVMSFVSLDPRKSRLGVNNK